MDSLSNVPEYSVGDLAGAIKGVLRENFGRVRVRGEITECKRYPSGHIYLSIKDSEAKLEAVVWKMTVRNLAITPENGIEIVATGRIDTYADRSKYQLVIEALEYAGEGALLAAIEKLRVKLLAEGLFAPERKRGFPTIPARIGVITSEKGAVIQDIRTTIARRFPRPILLWPVPVQGQGAAEKITQAIQAMGALPPGLRPDLLIIARGGGSLEDLAAFNDEALVRAAAACPIPVISAIGHETDTTLLDFAADRRAPTPTAAAEMAVPPRMELLADLLQRAGRLHHGMQAGLQTRRLGLERAARALPGMPDQLAQLRQRIDDRAERLRQAMLGQLAGRGAALGRLGLPHPREGVAARHAQLKMLGNRLQAGWAAAQMKRGAAPALGRFSAAPIAALLRQRATELAGQAARLESVSYVAVLARGFALVQAPGGKAITRAAQARAGAAITLTFADGKVAARVQKREDDAAQGSLL